MIQKIRQQYYQFHHHPNYHHKLELILMHDAHFVNVEILIQTHVCLNSSYNCIFFTDTMYNMYLIDSMMFSRLHLQVPNARARMN